MTVTWAWAENALAMTVGVINENAGPIKGHPEAPLSMKKRVSCLRAALRDITSLHHLQQDGSLLAKRFIELSARRNELTHGSAWQVPEGGFQAIGLPIERGNFVVKDHRFDVESTRLLTVEISKLCDDATAFMLRVGNVFKK